MDLNKDDVVSMISGKSVTSSPTFLVEEFIQKWKSKFVGNNGYPQTEYFYFLDEGVDCKILKPNGSGWKKGVVRFRLEFIPEDNNEIDVQATVIEQKALSPSALDDLRSQLSAQ